MAQQRTVITLRGIEELRRGLTDLQQTQFPFAMKEALNATAAKVKAAVVDRMDADFDRPTPFTKNSMAIDYASKTDLSARVHFKDPTRLSDSQHYLYPSTYGVKRGFKKFEAALYGRGLLRSGWYAVPGKDQPLDAFGNVPTKLINEILSYFDANPLRAGYTQNMTDATRARKKRGTRSTFGYEFFVVPKKNGRMLPGIYRRVFLGDQIKIYSIFIFVPTSSVWYPAQYKFHATGRDVFSANLKPIFGEKLQQAMETALR